MLAGVDEVDEVDEVGFLRGGRPLHRSGNLDLLIRDSVQAQGYQVAVVARAARVSRETVYVATRRTH